LGLPAQKAAGRIFFKREDRNEYVNALVIREVRRRVSYLNRGKTGFGSTTSRVLRLHLRNRILTKEAANR
jgi:hypothetical protein